MGKKANPAIVGAFVLGAVALAVLGVLVFGSGRWFRTTIDSVMYFPGSVDGLSNGAPVKFKGVDIGTVTNIQLVLTTGKKGPTARIPVYVRLDPSKIVTTGDVQFPNDSVREELINRGMRAQLQSQSLLTGLLFIQLDFFPDTPVTYVLKQPSDPPEIPTLRVNAGPFGIISRRSYPRELHRPTSRSLWDFDRPAAVKSGGFAAGRANSRRALHPIADDMVEAHPGDVFL